MCHVPADIRPIRGSVVWDIPWVIDGRRTSIGSLLCAHSRSSPLAPDLSHVAASTSSTTHPLPPPLHGLIPTGRRRSDGAITGKRTRRSSTVGRPTSCHFSLSLPILALGYLSASLLSFPTRCTRTHGRVIGTSMDHDFTTTVFVTEEGRPQRRLRSAKRHLLSTRRLSPRAPRCSRFSFSLHPSLE